MAEMMRAHVLLPRDLVEEFDRRVGERKRSERLAELMADFLFRERQREFFTRLKDEPVADDHEHWSSGEKIDRWVRELRAEAWDRPEFDDSALPDD